MVVPQLPGSSAPGSGDSAEIEELLGRFEKFKEEVRGGKTQEPSVRPLLAAQEAAKREKKKKKRKGSSSDDEEGGHKAFFRGGSSREVDSIRKLSATHPGQLYENGLQEISRFLASRGEPGGTLSAPKMVAYLTSIFHYSTEKVGARDSRELRTLAEAIDLLGEGRLPQVCDLLMQRFKAVEGKVIDGDWGVASRLELLPERPVGLASLPEQTAATRSHLLHLKLEEARKKHKGG